MGIANRVGRTQVVHSVQFLLNYPVPIVEHKAARLRALEAFKQKS